MIWLIRINPVSDIVAERLADAHPLRSDPGVVPAAGAVGGQAISHQHPFVGLGMELPRSLKKLLPHDVGQMAAELKRLALAGGVVDQLHQTELRIMPVRVDANTPICGGARLKGRHVAE